MTTSSTTGLFGANSSHSVNWETIDWSICHRTVRRLQFRIAKATKVKRWRTVRSLQRLLVRSFAARALAVKRVTDNRGSKTPGVDGELWTSSADKVSAILSLTQRGYRTQPLRRIHIPKSNGKKRPLGIPTLRDRAMQALHLLALAPVSESTADPNSYGFRPHRSTADAIARCFMVLALRNSPQWVMEGDIKGCFDNIDHEWLIRQTPMDKDPLRKWLKAGFMERGSLFPTEAGTPQGGIISPTLANLALDGLERLLLQKYPRRAGPVRYKVHLIRYADDFIITADSKERLEYEIKPLVADFLKERGLELSREKTAITHIDQGFDFLGQSIRKYNGTLLIKPSRKSQKAFKAKVKEALKRLRSAPQDMVVHVLNPIIRGWANYHVHVVSKQVFASMDHWIWRKLWTWATRRHPNKPRRWIKARYFDRIGSRDWVFRANKMVVKGKIRTLTSDTKYPVLASMVDMPIRRHVKIKADADPFDPRWDEYFGKRARKVKRPSSRGQLRSWPSWATHPDEPGRAVPT